MDNNINIDQVLMQMRVLASQAQGIKDSPWNQENNVQADFSDLLTKSIKSVNEVQKASGDLKQRFELGDESVSMVDIAVASEKAKIAFTAMTEVRGKLIEAYKEIMNMPI